MSGKKNQIVCAFCGNTPDKKRDTFFIPSMYEGLAICSDCIDRAGGVLADATGKPQKKAGIPDLVVPDPRTIKAELDRHVIGQDHAKKNSCSRCPQPLQTPAFW